MSSILEHLLSINPLYSRGSGNYTTGPMPFYNNTGSPELTTQSSQLWTNSEVNASGGILTDEYPKVSSSSAGSTLPGFNRFPSYTNHNHRTTPYSLPNTTIYGEWPYSSGEQYLSPAAPRNRPFSAAASLSAMAAEPGHGGVPDCYKNYYGYNGATRTPMHTTEEKSNRRLSASRRVGLVCAKCHASDVSLWRRNSLGDPVCNSCGLDSKYGCSKIVATETVHQLTERFASLRARLTCAKCNARNTSLWRRNSLGKPVCNACGRDSKYGCSEMVGNGASVNGAVFQ